MKTTLEEVVDAANSKATTAIVTKQRLAAPADGNGSVSQNGPSADTTGGWRTQG